MAGSPELCDYFELVTHFIGIFSLMIINTGEIAIDTKRRNALKCIALGWQPNFLILMLAALYAQ